MSETPKTDALIAQLSKDSGCEPEGNDLVVIQFLRQLERECEALRSAVRDANEIVDQIPDDDLPHMLTTWRMMHKAAIDKAIVETKG
jgi:hypothetical protein